MLASYGGPLPLKGRDATMRVVAVMMVLLVCGVTTAATINVPADYTTIQAAVDAASNGDEILVAPGTYTGTGSQVVDMLGKAITLRSSGGATATVIDGENERGVIRCERGETAATVIDGFSVVGGTDIYFGGGISCYSSSPTLRNCMVYGNTVRGHPDLPGWGGGGGIGCYWDSNPWIEGCTISDNTASFGGGVYCYSSSPTFTQCSVSSNSSVDIEFSIGTDGGGVYCVLNSSPTFIGCSIANNMAVNDGGGVFCRDSNPTFDDCLITGNVAAGAGGGVCLSQSGATMDGGSIADNTANVGGGIYCAANSMPELTNVAITDNTAGSGAGLACDGNSNASLTNCTIAENVSSVGGGVWCYSSNPILTGCLIANNSASGQGGGGVSCQFSAPTFVDCTITGNICSEVGGGLAFYHSSSPLLTSCTVTANSSSRGGGIYCSGEGGPWITNCTIDGNTASELGGGLFSNGSMPVLNGTTMCNNASDQLYGSWLDAGNNSICGTGACCLGAACGQLTIDTCLAIGGEFQGDMTNCNESLCVSGTAEWTVDDDGPADFSNIQAAIDVATAGDTISVAPGTYTGLGDNVIDFLGKPLLIKASGAAENTIIDGEGTRRAAHWEADAAFENFGAVLSGFTITGGAADVGGGLYCGNGTVRVTSCIITNNTAELGSGVYCEDSSAKFSNCIVVSNTSEGKGGFYCAGNSITLLEYCEIANNLSQYSCGGFVCDDFSAPLLYECVISSNSHAGVSSEGDASLTLTNCVVNDNQGRGIFASGRSLTLLGCDVFGNWGISWGGGVYMDGSVSGNIIDCTIRDNTSESGGAGIYGLSTGSQISHTRIFGNSSATGAGGIETTQSYPGPLLQETIICGNVPDQVDGQWISGGGVCINSGCADLDDDGIPDPCQGPIDDGVHEVPQEFETVQDAIDAAGYGDVVLVSPGVWTGSGEWVINPGGKPVTIESTHGSDVTTLDGEGLRRVVMCRANEDSSTVIRGFTITGGTSLGNWTFAGGVNFRHNTSPTLEACRVTANGGYGISIQGDGSPTISNCSIDSNSGGGIRTVSYGSPVFLDCSIYDNVSGGGVSILNGVSFVNCSIVGNTSSSNGGGVNLVHGSVPAVFTNCLIDSNTAAGVGGGVYSWAAAAEFEECRITNNSAAGDGGGIYCDGAPALTMTLVNSTVCGNTDLQVHCSIVGGGETSCSVGTQADCDAAGGFYFGDGSDCSGDPCGVGGGDCPAGQIEDCNGNCFPPEYFLGGLCDDGTKSWNGIPIYLNCDQFNCDWGSCNCEGDPTGGCCVGNIITDQCFLPDCDGDFNDSGSVGLPDLNLLFDVWGQSSEIADIDGDGVVDVRDLLLLLEFWGPCP